jgi:hypothetical protein
MRPLLIASLCLIAALLSSCIDGREEFWLRGDGSGAAEVVYEVPAAAAALKGGDDGLRRMLEEWLARRPEIRREHCDVTTTGDRTRIHVRVAFDSALKLLDLSDPESTRTLPAGARHLSGAFDFRLHGRDVELTRTISPGKALFAGLLMPKEEIEGRRLVYTVHLPEAALESNATRTENGGKTLIWDFALADGLKQPLVTRLKTRMPIPAWLVASGAGLAALLLGVIVTVLRRGK